MSVSLYVTGWFVCYFVKKKNDSPFWDYVDVIILCGITATAVFCQLASLFSGINCKIYILHFLFVFIIAVCYRSGIRSTLIQYRPGLSWKGFAVFLCLVLYFSYTCRGGSFNGDDYLYHYQSVRWFEQYGTVRGLGNLHYRFSFSSSMLHLQALYSWSDLKILEQGVYGLVSFAVFLSVIYSLYMIYQMKKHRESLLCTKGLLPLLMIMYVCTCIQAKTVAGLNTDICPNLLVLYIFTKWNGMAVHNDSEIAHYGYISCISAFAVTMNLSAGMMALFSIPLLYKCIKEKRIKAGMSLVCVLSVIIFPMIIRSFISSGYFLWPSTVFSIFDVSWKVPFSRLENYVMSVKVWGRGLSDLLSVENGIGGMDLLAWPFYRWFPHWFSKLSHIDKILFSFSMANITVFLLKVLYRWKDKSPFHAFDFEMAAAAACFLFWLFETPDMRFGQNYMWILLIQGVASFKDLYPKILHFGMVTVLCFNLYNMINMFGLSNEYLLKPYKIDIAQDYEECIVESDEGSSVTIYRPLDGEYSEYSPFPAAPYAGDIAHLRMFGNDMKDGFYSVLEE